VKKPDLLSSALIGTVASARIAGAALAPRSLERAGALVVVGTAVPLAYLTLAGRKRAIPQIGQTRRCLIEDALIVAAGFLILMLSVRSRGSVAIGH